MKANRVQGYQHTLGSKGGKFEKGKTDKWKQ